MQVEGDYCAIFQTGNKEEKSDSKDTVGYGGLDKNILDIIDVMDTEDRMAFAGWENERE